MKTSTALKLYPTKTDLARALGITRQAVSKWPDEVPQSHLSRLQELRGMTKAQRVEAAKGEK